MAKGRQPACFHSVRQTARKQRIDFPVLLQGQANRAEPTRWTTIRLLHRPDYWNTRVASMRAAMEDTREALQKGEIEVLRV
jgi:hypothetical protein